jgi:hypothetical protein
MKRSSAGVPLRGIPDVVDAVLAAGLAVVVMAGMRARVEGVGGTFAAGPRDGGGFQVVARLPVPGGAA